MPTPSLGLPPSFDIDSFLQQAKAPEFNLTLAKFVLDQFNEADQHRRNIGIEKMMTDSVRAYKSQYNPEDMALLDNPNEVYMGITNLKCRALQSWLIDIFLQTEDKPWSLVATPVPELPTRLESIVVSRLQAELDAVGVSGFNVPFEDVVMRAKQLALQAAQEIARDSTERMEEKIADQMFEGNWRDTFEQFIIDLSVMPNAIVKGPIAARLPKLRWVDGHVVTSNDVQLKSHRVNPLNIYPAPNATCPQTGAYIIERMRMHQNDLMGCVGLYGFDEVAIRQVIGGSRDGDTNWLGVGVAELDALFGTKSDAAAPDQLYDVLVYYGLVPGRLLYDEGIDLQADIHRSYECEVWVCNRKVLRAISNPFPLQQRPFYSVPYQPEPGSFWGRSLPSILHDTQRLANAAARSIVKNMAFSAGPIGEYDSERLVNESDIENLVPFRLVATKSDPYGSQVAALRFHNVTSVTPALLRAYDRFALQADDVSGIPAYAMGQPNTAGAGRTLGGLTMLMGNAARGVKRVVGLVDKHLTEPLVTAFYRLNLIYSKDESIKADAAAVARGSSGLLQRELSQARAIEVLNLLMPYVQAGLVDTQSVLIVLRDVVRSLGYSVDDLVPDPKREQRMQAALSQFMAPGQQAPMPRPAAPGTPIPQVGELPPLDPAEFAV